MKIILLNYGASDFRHLQNRLDGYSQAGYNPTSIGRIAFLKKGPRKYYLAVPFVSYQTERKEIAAAKVAWFEKMAMEGLEYLGRIGGIHVFSSDHEIEYKLPYEPLADYFLKGELLKSALKALAILVPGLFLVSLIYGGQISQYLTNGRIMLRWVLYFGIAVGVLISGLYGYQAVAIGRKIAVRDSELTNFNHEKIRLAKMGLILAFVIALIGGFALDSYDNDLALGDIDKVISLKTLRIESETVNTQFTTNHSYLIPYSYTYFEQAGAVDENTGELGDLLKVEYYEFSSQALEDRLFQDFMDLDSQNLDHLEQVESGVYLGYDKTLNLYSNLYLKKGNICLVVYTNFDLLAYGRVEAIMDNYLVD